jgi:hypothetical protein
MKYVTTRQIAEHAQKRRETVVHALRATKTPVVKQPGVMGLRVALRDANAFIALMWPEIGPMNVQERVTEEAR